jgi:hypothetical protein
MKIDINKKIELWVIHQFIDSTDKWW